MGKLHYQDYINELFRGEAYGIFIDDTGSPGITGAPNNYHPERKTWVAVVISPAQTTEVMTMLQKAINELSSTYGVDEFHFTDIYSGTKKFKNISLENRLNLFSFMAQIFQRYNLPIIVQTFDPETLAHVHERSAGKMPNKIQYFNLNKCNDLSLLFLFIRLKEFMKEQEPMGRKKARVFIDEGFKKNGKGMRIPSFENAFVESQICFAKSSTIYPIQLADFAAFSLNRMQLLAGKDRRTPLDLELLKILSPLSSNFINLEKINYSAYKEGPLFTLADTRPHGPFSQDQT